ncbi:hypothetical protein L6452_37611 [Arctium lappa]|uniref:Uncharacterized protein n=1 Tax=Arctium lappa TaxID=4217 RepID=A0ACB8Y3E9_ARCLA|nr:hypothetical protein L6452_37611 [Arctium lappa]
MVIQKDDTVGQEIEIDVDVAMNATGKKDDVVATNATRNDSEVFRDEVVASEMEKVDDVAVDATRDENKGGKN